MKVHTDDTRYTAYAIGELDEAECPEVEALLKELPVAQKAVQGTRQSATLLTKALEKETVPSIYREVRAEMTDRVHSPETETSSCS